MKKRIFALFLAVMIAFAMASFAGCTDTDENGDGNRDGEEIYGNTEYISIRGEQFSTELAFLGMSTVNGLQLTNDDIEPFVYMVNLINLRLSDNEISDISPLSGLTGLVQLDLSNCEISDISPLTGLVNLEKLFLSGNQISDVSVLAGLTGLTNLDLKNNPISAEQIAELRTALPHTQISYTDD